MIAVTTLIDRMNFLLDAEGSDRYLFDQDFKPAINSSIEWLVAVFNSAFSNNKLSEESLRELVKSKVYQTNSFSRVFLDSSTLGHEVWSILNVIPEPELHPSGSSITAVSNPEDSLYRGDLSFIKSEFSAKRLSSEEWHINQDNLFVAGNNRTTKSFKKNYAYTNFISNNSTSYSSGSEIEIRPEVSNSFVVIKYVKYPTSVGASSDSVEFPSSITDLLVQKALNFISYKQGDGTNLYGVTEKDVARLIQMMR